MMFSNLGRVLISTISTPRNHSDNGLVRMFEVEYSKEYRNAVRSGINVDPHYVREFLKSAR